jgi:neutral ceramidase
VGTLLAGAAEVVITPPVGTFLDGYGARTSGSVGVHDDLHARALVVDDGAAQIALVSCDLIAVDRRLVAAVRSIASSATGIAAEHILVAATHTHAGPAGLRAELDGPLTENMARLIAGAIVAAHGKKQPAVLKAGRGSVDSVSQNRRDPAGPADDALRVLLFDSPEARDAPVASVVNFACHATVLYHSNMQISADYPGYTLRTVKKIVGDAPSLFFNGACGDVNPAWIEQDYHEAERVGSIVGAEAARRLQELRPLGAQNKVWNIRWDELTDKPVTSGDLIMPKIRVASRAVPLRLRELGAPESYEHRLTELRRERAAVAPADVEQHRRVMEQITRLSGERAVAERLRPDGARTLHPEIQAIGLGEGCAILGLPGEFFVETARAIQAAAGLRHLLIACYANHHVFYVVPRHEFERGGYEPGVSMLDESAEETIRVAAIQLLKEVAS